jgi:hypothetical protein
MKRRKRNGNGQRDVWPEETKWGKKPWRATIFLDSDFDRKRTKEERGTQVSFKPLYFLCCPFFRLTRIAFISPRLVPCWFLGEAGGLLLHDKTHMCRGCTEATQGHLWSTTTTMHTCFLCYKVEWASSVRHLLDSRHCFKLLVLFDHRLWSLPLPSSSCIPTLAHCLPSLELSSTLLFEQVTCSPWISRTR